MCKYCDQHSNDCCIYTDPLTKEWYEDIETMEWDNYDGEYIYIRRTTSIIVRIVEESWRRISSCEIKNIRKLRTKL